LRHRLKTGGTAKRSLHKALRTRALSETLKERYREFTSFRILASNDESLLKQTAVTHCTISVGVTAV